MIISILFLTDVSQMVNPIGKLPLTLSKVSAGTIKPALYLAENIL